MTTSSENRLNYFQRMRNRQGEPAFDRRRVTLLGWVLGALSGLAFGVVGHWLNGRSLVGVPWVEYPLGMWGNYILLIVFGSAAGGLCAGAQDFIEGVIKGTPSTIILFGLYLFLTPYNSLQERLELMLWGLAPMIIFGSIMVFFLAFLRWAVDKQIEFSEQPAWHPRRILPLLGVIGTAAILGIAAYAPGGQLKAMDATHWLIQAGLTAPDAASLPAELQPKRPPFPHVRDFLQNAVPGYTVEVLRDMDLRQDLNAWSESPSSVVVLARFTNDWVVICQYDPPLERVLACQDYDPGVVPPPWISPVDRFLLTLR